ncbi:MAG: DUF4142 domain-containing protein, partial [Paracoccaceae bacterium]
DKGWTVESLASEVAMSRSRFAERFSQLVGVGPMTYLSDWRLQKALALLERSQSTVQEIAGKAGYASPAAFTRAFAGKFGLAPSEYRRRAAGICRSSRRFRTPSRSSSARLILRPDRAHGSARGRLMVACATRSQEDKMIRTTLIAALLVAGPAMAQDQMNDLQIAHTAYTAGQLDIRYAHLALAVSENDAVRAFAETMIRDHTAVNEAAVALITELNVTPENNDLSRALVEGAAAKRAEFLTLSGKDFDCAYAVNELGYHQVVNQTVEGKFIPWATVEPLKALLSDALVTFKVHEGHAEEMVAGLQCAS